MEPKQVFERLADVQLVDVRAHDEWASARIDGSLHIPMEQLPARLGELDPSRPVVAVCRSGARSGVVLPVIRRAGFDAHNLDGGLVAWAGHGLPLVREVRR